MLDVFSLSHMPRVILSIWVGTEHCKHEHRITLMCQGESVLVLDGPAESFSDASRPSISSARWRTKSHDLSYLS